jgi:hypothetical protein
MEREKFVEIVRAKILAVVLWLLSLAYGYDVPMQIEPIARLPDLLESQGFILAKSVERVETQSSGFGALLRGKLGGC